VPPLAASPFYFFLSERFIFLRRLKRPLLGRLTVNLSFAAVAFVTVSLTVRPAAEAMLGWTGHSGFGLAQLTAVPSAVRPLLAFLLMDLTFYWWHRANHRIPLLWRFHNVHHLDPDMDVSTAFRFHFGELAFSSAIRVAQFGLLGPSLGGYLVYEAVFQAGTLFSFWDRLHRTLRLNIPQGEIDIGIPGYAGDRDNSLGSALLAPFRAQRDYWRRADGSVPARGGAAEDKGCLAP